MVSGASPSLLGCVGPPGEFVSHDVRPVDRVGTDRPKGVCVNLRSGSSSTGLAEELPSLDSLSGHLVIPDVGGSVGDSVVNRFWEATSPGTGGATPFIVGVAFFVFLSCPKRGAVTCPAFFGRELAVSGVVSCWVSTSEGSPATTSEGRARLFEVGERSHHA